MFYILRVNIVHSLMAGKLNVFMSDCVVAKVFEGHIYTLFQCINIYSFTMKQYSIYRISLHAYAIVILTTIFTVLFEFGLKPREIVAI